MKIVLFLERKDCSSVFLMKRRGFISLGLNSKIFWLQAFSVHHFFWFASILFWDDVIRLQCLSNHFHLKLTVGRSLWKRRMRSQSNFLWFWSRSEVKLFNRRTLCLKWTFHDIIKTEIFEKRNWTYSCRLLQNQFFVVDLTSSGATGSASIKSIELIEFIYDNSLFSYSPKMQNKDPYFESLSFGAGSRIYTLLSWLIKRLEEGIFKLWDPEPEKRGRISSFRQNVNNFFPGGLSKCWWLLTGSLFYLSSVTIDAMFFFEM